VSPRPGRKKITDVRHDRRIVRAVEANRFVSAAKLAADVGAEIGRKVSKWTIRSRIHAAGLNGRSARKKPFLSKKHRRARLLYAKKYGHLTAEDWDDVLFTDEAKVELHGTTGRVSVWRRTHEAFSSKCVLPTFKSGRQSVMVWGSICGNGVGTLHICSESVTGDYYRHILRSEVPITRLLNDLPAATSFVQDNAPAHRAKLTKKCIEELNLKDLRHPAQSPDLNPIANVWAEMKRELNRDPATSLDDLKLKLKGIWAGLDDGFIRKCVRSMASRLDAVKKERGGHTKY
jgi:transposase